MAGARARLVPVATLDGSPTGLAMRKGDPAMYVIVRDGHFERISATGAISTFLDLSRKVSLDGEGGAFDVAFTTDGTQILLSYEDRSTHDLMVARMALARDGTAGRPEIVATIADGGEIHNAGKLLVLPRGDLLVGVGDGGELNDVAGRARRPGSVRGRILRFAGLGRAGAKPSAPSTIAFGLRNPWRFFRDPVTRTIWIGDVGQARWEEVDRLRADGRPGSVPDFGWDLTEGFQRARGLPPKAMQYPAMVRRHDGRHCAIIGGPIVRDRVLAGLVGTLVVGDFCSSHIDFVRMGRSGQPLEQREVAVPRGSTVTSFAVGLRNEVYVLQTDGVVSRVDPDGPALHRTTTPFEVRSRPTRRGPAAICGLPEAIAGYPAMQGKPPAEVRRLVADQRAALAFYRSADLPAAAVAPFRELDQALERYLDGLASVGWDTSDPRVAFGKDVLTHGSAAYQHLAKLEAAACT